MIIPYSYSTICTVFLLCRPLKFVIARPTFEDVPFGEETTHLEEKRIKHFTKTVLDKLGYQNIPSGPTVNLTIGERREMVKIYRQHMESRGGELELDQEGDHRAGILHVASFYPSALQMRKNRHFDQVIHTRFNINLSGMGDPFKDIAVHSAQLKFSNILNISDRDTSRNIKINVFRMLKNGTFDKEKWEFVSSKTISYGELKHVSIDISHVVQEWVSSERLGELKIAFHSLRNMKHQPSLNLKNEPIWEHPELEVTYHEHHILERVKRHVDKNECTVKDKEKKCCRYKQWISFKDIGWDSWVIAPEGYHSYYCHGTCPYRYKLANTFSGIKSSLHRKKPKVIPAPCCTATKYSPLTLLHFDEFGIMTFTHHPDMIVDECMCR